MFPPFPLPCLGPSLTWSPPRRTTEAALLARTRCRRGRARPPGRGRGDSWPRRPPRAWSPRGRLPAPGRLLSATLLTALPPGTQRRCVSGVSRLPVLNRAAMFAISPLSRFPTSLPTFLRLRLRIPCDRPCRVSALSGSLSFCQAQESILSSERKSKGRERRQSRANRTVTNSGTGSN